MSALALAAHAKRVVAMDASGDMLARTTSHPRVAYVGGLAEALPFPGGTFDLITVGLAFHWFDQAAFLDGARRVLGEQGWLVVYNVRFSGEMLGNPDFTRWWTDSYLNRFPPPVRRGQVPVDAEAARYGFELLHASQLESRVDLSLAQFVEYLTTHSNVIEAVQRGRTSLEATIFWLRATLLPLFAGSQASFRFDGTVWILRKDPG